MGQTNHPFDIPSWQYPARLTAHPSRRFVLSHRRILTPLCAGTALVGPRHENPRSPELEPVRFRVSHPGSVERALNAAGGGLRTRWRSRLRVGGVRSSRRSTRKRLLALRSGFAVRAGTALARPADRPRVVGRPRRASAAGVSPRPVFLETKYPPGTRRPRPPARRRGACHTCSRRFDNSGH